MSLARCTQVKDERAAYTPVPCCGVISIPGSRHCVSLLFVQGHARAALLTCQSTGACARRVPSCAEACAVTICAGVPGHRRPRGCVRPSAASGSLSLCMCVGVCTCPGLRRVPVPQACVCAEPRRDPLASAPAVSCWAVLCWAVLAASLALKCTAVPHWV